MAVVEVRVSVVAVQCQRDADDDGRKSILSLIMVHYEYHLSYQISLNIPWIVWNV
jgi:hypothetical protein